MKVENYGAKLKAEDIESLFEPFYRADKSQNRHHGGAGLGLYIVKSILDLHQLTYELRNSEVGVIFTIKIPMPEHLNVKSEKSNHNLFISRHYWILIVEIYLKNS